MIMNRKWIFLLLTLLIGCTYGVDAQNVSIKGKTKNAKDKVIEVYKDADKFSKKEQLLDYYAIGDNQTFELEFTVKYPTLVFLQIENYSQSFFVEPGKDYEVVIHEFDWNIDEVMNVYQNPVALPLEFVGLDEDDLNFQMSAFDSVESEMILKYRMFLDFRFKKDAKRIDTMMAALQSVWSDSDNEFFQSYKRHKIAELNYLFRLVPPRKIAEEYFKAQPIMYDDEGYTSLFNTFFSDYISKGTKLLPIETLSRWVDEADLFKYLDSLGVDPILQHEQLRELVALKALQESYYNDCYNSKMVIEMLKRFANESKFDMHRNIALNVLNSFDEVVRQMEIPRYELPNVDKETVVLDDMKGKWLYVGFVRVNDPNSLCEIETLAHFRDSIYQLGEMEFVTISCDREFQKLYHFIKNSKRGSRYNWTWLHFDGNFKMLDTYEVRSYPHFILINPDGKVESYSAPKPGDGFFVNSKWLKQAKVDGNEADQAFPFDKKR